MCHRRRSPNIVNPNGHISHLRHHHDSYVYMRRSGRQVFQTLWGLGSPSRQALISQNGELPWRGPMTTNCYVISLNPASHWVIWAQHQIQLAPLTTLRRASSPLRSQNSSIRRWVLGPCSALSLNPPLANGPTSHQ